MQITVNFDSIEEMKDFTELVMVGSRAAETVPAKKPAPAPKAAPAIPPVQQAPAMPAVQQPAVVPSGQPAAAPVQPAVAAPVMPPVQPPVAAPVQTTPVQYTPDDLARAAMVLMDSGRQQELVGLLQQFGVNAIPSLRPDQIGPFATALRGMGAQI